MDTQILSEKVVSETQGFKTVKRWLKGVHADKGVITKGLTGLETLQVSDVIKIRKFWVA